VAFALYLGKAAVAANRELARFNDYVIQQKKDIAKLKTRIRELKANCEKVRTLRDKLDARTESRSRGSMLLLSGEKAQQRALELHGSLSNFYADDQRMIELFRQTLELVENGIRDVENALGPPGMLNPYKIPEAAQILQAYAVLFYKPQNKLHKWLISEARTASIRSRMGLKPQRISPRR
jgi:uncharacterized coiled-coil protein SlyX